MIYLTAEQVLFVHGRLIEETGGTHAIRDLGLLQSAIARPQASFGDAELFPDLFAKTAALMQSLVQNHPFVDGNKRVGITAAGLFLRLNGRRLAAGNEELERFTMAVAQGQVDLEVMTAWFREFSEFSGP